MRIALLSQWYRPEPEIKVHLLARDLARRGHDVTAITGLPNYPTGRLYPGYRFRPWPQVEWMDGVRVVRVPLFPDHSRSGLRRVANYASFALAAAVFGPLLSGPIDVMWVHHPPLTVALPAIALSVLRRVPFVLEVQDLWPETLAATGMVESVFALSTVDRVAKLLYRAASRVTVISPGFKKNLVGKGVPEEKIEVMPNWADEDVYAAPSPDGETAEGAGTRECFTILYAGNMGAAQGLDNLLNAAALLRGNTRIQFVLVGGGLDRERLRARATAERLDNVRFLERVPARDIPRLAACADVMLVHLKRDPLFEITIPSKTISSLACGRPVLTVSEGDPADVIRQARAGLSCRPDDPSALAAAVQRLFEMPAQERRDMGVAARAHYESHFTRSRLVPRYEKLLMEVASSRS